MELGSMETDEAVPALPDDVTTAILGRLRARSLAASRCICEAWHDLVDEDGLLQRIWRRLIPHSVSSIFVNYVHHGTLDFFACPQVVGSTPRHGVSQSGSLETDAVVLALPDDVLAAILRRLPTRRRTASRCVCRAWRDLIDERGLLERIRRILPHSVSGIFVNYVDHYMPHFFARPTSAAAAGPAIDGDFSYVPESHPNGWYKVVDHCNGLVLYRCERSSGELYVCNPTTRWCTRLPQLAAGAVSRRRAFLAFSPALSRHYQVLLGPLDLASEEEQRFCYHRPDAPAPPAGDTEWPPSRWTWHVFSSRNGRWRETVFVRQGEAAGIVADLRMDSVGYSFKPLWRYGVHRQGALYVHCRGEYISRLSLSAGDYSYRVIKSPIDRSECSKNVRSFLGRSKGEVYFVAIKRCGLRVWMLNDSQRSNDPTAGSEWILKHDRVLQRIHWRRIDGSSRHIFHQDGPWILDDYFNKREDMRKLDWSTDDDDNAICSNADREEEEEELG